MKHYCETFLYAVGMKYPSVTKLSENVSSVRVHKIGRSV